MTFIQTVFELKKVQLFLISIQISGLKNLTALGNVIQWQKLEYDFKFHQLEIETNLVSQT